MSRILIWILEAIVLAGVGFTIFVVVYFIVTRSGNGEESDDPAPAATRLPPADSASEVSLPSLHLHGTIG